MFEIRLLSVITPTLFKDLEKSSWHFEEKHFFLKKVSLGTQRANLRVQKIEHNEQKFNY